MRFLTNSLLAAAAAAGLAEAVIVSPGSPCSSKCGNVPDSTAPDDIVCSQDAYAVEGQLFQECVQCEVLSDHVSSGQSDTQWALYNLRYAMSYCLFGVPENDDVLSTPCITSEACGPFRLALQYGNLSSSTEPYEYCDVWPSDDEQHVQQCGECLFAGQEYLSNFFSVLQAGCQQKPEPGTTVAIDGNVFSTEPIKITDPTPQATVDPSWFDQGPLDVGAKAGIAAGALVVLLAIVGCFIVLRGKRRRRAFLRNYDPKLGRKSWPSPAQVGGMRQINTAAAGASTHNGSHHNHTHAHNNSGNSGNSGAYHGGTPLSQRPLRDQWDDSPMTAASEQPFQRYFSPYSSHFGSPVSATDALQQQHPQWPVLGGAEKQMTPHEVERSIGLAFGGVNNDRGGGGSDEDGKKPEAYEMQRVEGGHGPFISSPVEGRVAAASPQQQQQQQDEEYFSHGHSRTYSGTYRNFAGSRAGQHGYV